MTTELIAIALATANLVNVLGASWYRRRVAAGLVSAAALGFVFWAL